VNAWQLATVSPEETHRLGCCLGREIRQPVVLLLVGELGAGKTCLAQGVAVGLEVPADEPVVSPSYTLMNVYPGRLEMYHFDLYRLSDPDELHDLGVEEYLPGAGVALVEWGNRFSGLSDDFLQIEISHASGDGRRFNVSARGPVAGALLERFRQAWQAAA
jgi:tRNA threonylcarbamoyladenosine biosynthesis protein TsaE